MKGFTRGHHLPVSQRHIQQVTVVEIALRLREQLERGGKGIAHEMHLMQVEMLHIGDQHGFHILLLQLAIQ